MNYLITIVGPTAIGKTALSIALAQHYNCEIISCDSRQFFKEMNIGTAVPSLEELNQVPHHFIQNKSILEPYTVGDFEKEAIATLDILFKKNPIQIMVGGSGLYVDAVLNGLDSFPEVQEEVKLEVQNQYNQQGLEYLQNKLQELDSYYFNQLKNNNPQTLLNPQRLMRFVSVCMSSGKPHSFFLTKNQKNRNFTPIIIGLETYRNTIYTRINQRVDIMIENGLLQEAQSLYSNKDLNALQTVGYKELFQYFEKEFTLREAVEEIKKNTRRFSKRQLTWFKKNPNVKWFDYQTPISSIIENIHSELNFS